MSGGGQHWPASPAHRAWLAGHTDHLLAFASGSRVPAGGFGWLDDSGARVPDRPQHLFLVARMTHVHALGHLVGRPGCGSLADHGVAALATGPLHDAEHGGWRAATDDPRKEAYGHAHVVLAASSAAAAGRPGAEALLDEALDVVDRRFWVEADGLVAESWDPGFTTLDDYRGANATMHMVEAFLAAADVTGDDVWLHRAVGMGERIVHGFARDRGWRLPEHFDAGWRPLPEYNAAVPSDQFRPYGVTVGHQLEWSRLCLHAAAALRRRGTAVPAWLEADAAGLFAAAVERGWSVDGGPGFVYTLDWDDRPVVRQRLHWVVTEGIGAAAALLEATGDPAYDRWYRAWWDHAAEHFLDPVRGSWRHELDAQLQPATTVWTGKPDVYHALQATLVPRLPLAPSFAAALAAGLLRQP